MCRLACFVCLCVCVRARVCVCVVCCYCFVVSVCGDLLLLLSCCCLFCGYLILNCTMRLLTC